ncbi:NRPS [Ceratocystis pirilliformis]|uniref:NRPS n=1 Tax=Ceratocystis pirilliformis TaxID=259994 RepID=A0ABR3YKB0_9PEZI
MAASNQQPTRISGPDLLHKLVLEGHSDAEFDTRKVAIEALLKDNTIDSVSYAELDSLSSLLGDEISQHLSLCKDTLGNRQPVIPILLPQCLELYIAQLAVLRAGAAFCPLNMDTPPDRLNFILNDVDARVILVAPDAAGSFALTSKVSCLAVQLGEMRARATDFHSGGNSPCARTGVGPGTANVHTDSLSYVMYTSGSTGVPKGVGVSHRAATQSLLAHNRYIPSFSRFLQFAAPTFDVSVFEIFFPLFRRATLISAYRPAMLDDLPGIIRKLRVDACELTPSVAGSLLVKREHAPELKLLLTIGEMLTERVISEFGGTEARESILWAMYGPTEAAIHCTLAPALPANASPSSIGFPLDPVSCFVVSEDGPFRVLEVGDVGELAIGGYQLADGYINRPEQTAAAFIDTPFGLLYRSGDRALMRPDGTFECLGRISEGQVKLRGQRMELGEVEHAALRFPGCHGAVAAVISQVLVLFCAVEQTLNGQDISDLAPVSIQIAAECRRWLPTYMLPGEIVAMASFPRLASGKVDRKTLKGGYASRMVEESATGEDKDLDEFQKQILEQVEELVGASVSTDMALASAGIDSLVALRLAAKLRQEGINIHALEILRAKRILDIAHLAASSARENTVVGVYSNVNLALESISDVLVPREDVEAVISCAPIQNAMLAETAKDSKAYCNQISLAFDFGVTLNQIRSSFKELVSLNPMLRSSFVELPNGQFAQLILKKEAQRDVVRVFDGKSGGPAVNTSIGLTQPLVVSLSQLSPESAPAAVLHIHHALYDGWSLDMLRADWSDLLRSKSVSPRPPFSVVTAFFAQSQPFAKSNCSAFWASHLNGWEPAVFPHLSQWARRDNTEVSNASHVVCLDRLSKSGLMRASRALRCGPQTFFQTALIWLLSQMTASSSVVIGNVFSGRTIPVPGIESVIGPCLASLPLRTDLSKTSSAAEALRLVHSTERVILDYLAMPLRDIKKVIRAGPGIPLWNVLFAYQETLVEAESLVHEIGHVDYSESNILVEIQPTGDKYFCSITYNEIVLPSSVAKIITKQLEESVFLLSTGAVNTLDEITLSLDNDLLSIYNPVYEPLSRIPDVSVAFEQAVAQAPHKDALIFLKAPVETGRPPEIETLSYRDLNNCANQIARLIQCIFPPTPTSGVVAVIMEKSPLLYKTILGVVKSGHAYLPLLPSTPHARVATIIEHANVGLCLVDSGTLKTLSYSVNCQVINLETSNLSNLPRESVWPPLDPNRPAYIIYTSGTTGVPKGVVATHLNLLGNVDVLSKLYPVTENSRLLQACSQAFDVSVFEIFWTWICGLPLCTGTKETLFENLEGAIRELKVTHLSMTPTVASLVRREAVPEVKFLVTAGEPMSEGVYREWAMNGSLFQGYGPSETTNICTVKKMMPGEYIGHLGFSFTNTSSFVMSPSSLTALPIGSVGELVFGGDQVTAGYLNSPELTAAKYQMHPVYGRIYRSGDLGRMLPDGSLMILGRIDDQLKVRGQRVDVGEINGIITNSGLGSASVTILVKDGLLSSFYVSNCGQSLSEKHKSLRKLVFSQFKSSLLSYMIPSFVIPVASVPLTPSGKIDSKSLVELFSRLPSEEAALFGTPVSGDESPFLEAGSWSPHEKAVAQAIATVLYIDINAIGLWTPLNSLGLDSFAAIRAAKALSLLLSCKVPVASLFRFPTVAQLSKQIGSTSHAEPPRAEPTLDAHIDESFVAQTTAKFHDKGLVVEAVLPCLPLQTAMLASAHEDTYMCRSTFALKIPVSDVRSLWTKIHSIRGILRTCFMPGPTIKFPFVQVQLSASCELVWISESDSIEGCFSRIKDALGSSVGSLRAPIGLGTVYENGQDILCMLMHHALYDGIAMDILFSEINALASGAEVPPDADYGAFLRSALTLPTSTMSFWEAHFEGFTPNPCDKRPSIGYKSSAEDLKSTVMRCNFSTRLSKLESRAREAGVSLLPVFQAAWATTIGLSLQMADVCFGNVFAGRNVDVADFDCLVAPCFNTLPFRVNFDKHRFLQIIQLVQHFQSLNTETVPYTFTALRDIQRQVVQRTGPGSLFSTLLLLQPPSSTSRDNAVWETLSDDSKMDVPIVCEVQLSSRADSFDVLLHYDVSFVSMPFVEKLTELLAYVLERIATLPFSSIPEFDLLPESLKIIREHSPALKDCNRPPIPSTDDSYEWSHTELAIRAVFAKLSNVAESKVKPCSTIYQLGLDSINAVQVASALRMQGFSVSGVDVLECLSCASLAERITITSNLQDQKYDTPASSDAIMTPRSSPEMTPVTGISGSPSCKEILFDCTPMQDAMIAEFIRTDGTAYFNHLVLQMDKSITRHKIKSALEGLATAQPMLRAGFVPADLNSVGRAANQMLVYPSILVPLQEGDSHFDLHAWKTSCARSALNDLSFPAWAVALFEDDKGSLILAFALHHALYDATSLQMILTAFSDIICGNYVSVSHIDLAVRKLESLYASSSEEAEKTWREIGKAMVVNDFPTLTPLSVSSKKSLSLSLSLSPSAAEIRDSIRDNGISTQAYMQATWTRVLGAYLGETNVTFGIVLSGRTDPQLEDAPFPCVTTLPIVLCDSVNNRDLLEASSKSAIKMQRYQYLRLSEIKCWAGRPNSRLFDTILVVQRDDNHADFPWQILEDEGTVTYPVSLEISSNGAEGLLAKLIFWSDVVPSKQAKLMLQQIDAVFSDLIRNPDGSRNELWKDNKQIVSILPPAMPLIPTRHSLLHEFVENMARKQPEATALEFIDAIDGDRVASRSWTYKQLDQLGDVVAEMLRSHVQVDDIVAIHFDKCPEAYFAILGILKAGCAFLALDPSAPSTRKQFILADSKAALVVCASSGPTLDIDPNALLPLDINTLMSRPVPERHPTSLARPDTRSYCLYTSGTTGTPKGCELTHSNAVQGMKAFQHLFDGTVTSSSRCLQFAAFHFDVCVLEQYWTWSVGMPVVAAPRDLILADIEHTLATLRISHVDLTPSLAALVRPEKVPSLWNGVFITGGEQLRREILDSWGPLKVIYNAYGPTEATIGVTMRQKVPENGRPANIGQQFPNVGSFVLVPGTDIPVLRGGVGELCVSGPLVGKGYLGRPDLTEERFPILQTLGERVYRTGDLVRVLCDGSFDFLGRADDQVKLRGQRLELGEISHAICTKVREIKHAVCLVVKHRVTGKDLLVAFISEDAKSCATTTTASGQQEPYLIDTRLCSKAKAACKEKLPIYMVPTYILGISYMPLSSNNKAEVKQLRAMFSELSPSRLLQISRSPDVSPSVRAYGGSSRTACNTENTIMHALRDFSGLQEIDRTSSFFDCGIDSISVARFVRLLRKHGLEGVSPALVLQNSTSAELSVALKETDSAGSAKIKEAAKRVAACDHFFRSTAIDALKVQSEAIEYVAPCTPLQDGMISRAMISRDGIYFNSFVFRLRDGLDIQRLKESWTLLVQDNAILRSAFVPTPTGYVQAALRSTDICWKEVSLRHESGLSDLMASLQSTWIEKNHPVIRTPVELTLVSTPAEKMMIVQIFHGVYDGESFGLILSYVASRLHLQYKVDIPNSVPSFKEVLSYGPLGESQESKEFWARHLAEWTPSEFPVPYSSSLPDPSSVSVKAEIRLDCKPLIATQTTPGASWAGIALSLWMFILSSHLPGNITTGILAAGRALELENTDFTIGPLFNTVPFYLSLNGKETWTDVVLRCQEFLAGLHKVQHASLRDLQKLFGGGKPLFESLFSYRTEQTQNWGDLWQEIEVPGTGASADYALAFEATKLAGHDMQLVLVAKPGILNEADLQGILSELEVKMRSFNSRLPFRVASPMQSSSATIMQPSSISSLPKETLLPPFVELLITEFSVFSGIEISQINPSSSIASLGLDSIDVVRFSSHLRTSAKITLAPFNIIKHETVQAIAEFLSSQSALVSREAEYEAQMRDSKWEALVQRISSSANLSGFYDVEAVLPATPLQETMVAKMLQSDYELYFNHDLREVAAGVDIRKLKSAFETLVRERTILRTCFAPISDTTIDVSFAQVVRKGPFLVDSLDLGSLDRLSQVISDARTQAAADSSVSPLFQVRFIAAEQKNYVLFSIAHALYDGWSLDILHEDLISAYHGCLTARPSPVSFLQGIFMTESQAASDFWKSYLSAASPALIAPSRNASTDYSSASQLKLVSLLSSAEVKSFAKSHSVSVQSLGLAVWCSVLSSLVSSLDVTFGVVLAGRDLPGAQDLMFPTMNTVAVRATLHGSMLEFVKYLDSSFGQLRQFQSYPLRKAIARALKTSKSTALFNTLFLLQKKPSTESSRPFLFLNSTGDAQAEYPISIEMELSDDLVVWHASIDPEFNIDKILSMLDKTLAILVSRPNGHVVELSSSIASETNWSHIPRQKSIMEEISDDYESPAENNAWTPTESIIRDVLAQTSGLPLEDVVKSSTLYKLGLDSIIAIKVSAILKERGLHVTSRQLLTAADIKSMAMTSKPLIKTNPSAKTPLSSSFSGSQLVWNPDISSVASQLCIPTSDIAQVLPCLPMQPYMLTACHRSNGVVFCPSFTYKLSGVSIIDTPTIEAAWKSTVCSLPILRTVLIPNSSKEIPFMQVVLTPLSLNLRDTLRIYNLPDAIPKFAKHEPLVRASISISMDNSLSFILSIHHALYDANSLPAIIEVFTNNIQDIQSNSTKSHAKIDMAPWEGLLYQPLMSTEKRKNFWTMKLYRGLSSCNFENIKPVNPEVRIESFRPSLIPDLRAARGVCAREDISIQAFVFAIFAQEISAADERRDVMLGIYMGNSGAFPELHKTFPTLSLIPLSVSIAPGDSVVYTAKKIQSELHLLSDPILAQTGLHEIYNWTGASVPHFFNFLAPAVEFGDIGDGEMPVHTTPLSPSSNAIAAMLSSRDMWQPVKEAFWPSLLEAGFQHSIDVEAAVEDNKLNIGIFGAEEISRYRNMEEMVDRVRDKINGFL